MTDTTRKQAEATANVYVRCPSCNGSGLASNIIGEPNECPECKGNTVVPLVPIVEMVELLKERAEAWRSVHDGLAELLAEAADLLEAVARERDEARAEAKEHLRLKNELVLKAYPAMDAAEARADRLASALEPFARVAEHDIGESESDADLFRAMSDRYCRAPLLTVGDFRRARAALGTTETGEDG